MDDKRFRTALEAAIIAESPANLHDLQAAFQSVAEALIVKGAVVTGPDFAFGGFALEVHVRETWRAMGFEVEEGPTGRHDAVVRHPFSQSNLLYPLVLEIKSGKNQSPSIGDLRQLDDWVFDLSGEEKARKRGLGGGGDVIAMATHGMVTSVKRHPTRHKGVLVYNGPLEVPFDRRSRTWAGANETEFANKRDFCLISWRDLLEWKAEIQRDATARERFWAQVHATQGVLTSDSVAAAP